MIPLFSFIIGDFVHLRNDDDRTKPIIALIFSIWIDEKYAHIITFYLPAVFHELFMCRCAN